MDRPSVYPCSSIASLHLSKLKAPQRFTGSESNSLITAGLKVRGNTHDSTCPHSRVRDSQRIVRLE